MIIGTCGFTASGSSAVTDYLKEFDNISVVDDFEFILVHGTDGLEDLYYHLCLNCTKYTSSTVAIERFRRHVYNFLLFAISDNNKKDKIKLLTDQFLDSIVQVRWTGFGSIDVQLFGGYFYQYKYFNLFWYKLFRKYFKFLPNSIKDDPKHFPAHPMELSMHPDDFVLKARKYVMGVLEVLTDGKNSIIAIDQPFCGNDPKKSFDYFECPKAIVVDRDPRDLYVFVRAYYHKVGYVYQIPTVKVEDFVKYFRLMRENQPYLEDDDILKIRLEDMIYNYDKTIKQINDFFDLDNNKRSKRVFNPTISVNNTQLFKRYSKYSSEILYIENELKDYLFPFDDYSFKPSADVAFMEKAPD